MSAPNAARSIRDKTSLTNRRLFTIQPVTPRPKFLNQVSMVPRDMWR